MNSRVLRGAAGLVGFFLIWEIVSRAGLVDNFLLPPASEIVVRMGTLFGQSDFVAALVATLLTWALALGITLLVAVPLGLLLGSVPGLRTATGAVIEFIRPIPAVALIPVSTVLLGAGPITTITLTVFAGTWPVLFGVVGAIRETDPMLLDTARVFGLRSFAVAARVRLPSVARAALIGFRVAVALELIIIVSTSLITGLDGGLGAYLWDAGEASGDSKTVLAGVVIIGILGYLVNQVLMLAQRLPWLHPTASGAPEVGQLDTSGRVMQFLQRWGTFVVAIVIWQVVAVAAHDLPYAPPPSTIAVAAWQNAATLAAAIPVSLAKLAAGWGIAVVGGVGLGLLLGLLPRTAEVIEPVGAFIRAVPAVLLIPVLVIWTHLGTALEITTIALGCAWPILVQTIEGVRSIEPTLLDTSRAYRTGRFRHMWTVVAPAAAPKIVTALRISLGLAVILMVIAEIRGGAVAGLGFQLGFASDQFEYALTWACFVLLGVFGYLLNQLLLFGDHRLLSWRHEAVTEV